MIDPLLDVEETAKYCAVSKGTIYRYANSNLIPCIKKRFGLRFRRSDLESWLDQGKRNCLPAAAIAFDLAPPPRPAIMGRGTTNAMVKPGKTKNRYNFGYGAIYQRKIKNGGIRWYVDYRSKGQRIQKLVPHAITQEEALLALQRMVAQEFNHEQGIQKTDQQIKFSVFSDVYLTNYAKVKKRSWRTDEKYIKAQLIPFFGEFELHEITSLHVSQFMVKRQQDGVKNSSINRELTVLKKMLALSIEWGYKIERNPVKKGNYFSEDAYRRERVLTSEEETRLFLAAAPHLRSILVCALATGMRYSEILRLSWENVDMAKLQITVKPETSKSGKKRIIPINKPLFNELLRLRRINEGRNDYVFLYEDSKTGKLRPVTTVRRAFTMACKRAKIKNLHFHDLRHTVGTRLISRGVDPITVKNILGHANLKTTEIYLHSSLLQMSAAVEKLDSPGCEKSEKPSNLLRICDAEKSADSLTLVTSSTTIN